MVTFDLATILKMMKHCVKIFSISGAFSVIGSHLASSELGSKHVHDIARAVSHGHTGVHSRVSNRRAQLAAHVKNHEGVKGSGCPFLGVLEKFNEISKGNGC